MSFALWGIITCCLLIISKIQNDHEKKQATFTGRAVQGLILDLNCFTPGKMKSSKDGAELHVIFSLAKMLYLLPSDR